MYNFNRQRPQLGISSCVTGQAVRYDAGHKRSTFCVDVLGEHVDFLPLCPEMAIGMGSPRPTIRLVQEPTGLIARCADGRDLTQPLRDYGREKSQELDCIAGYILCAKSPSCGMERVKVYDAEGKGSRKTGTGVFAAQLMAMQPNLPVEEDGRLNDPMLRENFIARVYAYHDWICLIKAGLNPAALIEFHSRYKLLVMAHSPVAYRELGQQLADLSKDIDEIARCYIAQLMRTLAQLITRRNHANVLQHIQGYLKNSLSSAERVELAKNIDKYRIGKLPLLAPITLIRHYLAVHPNDYMASQRYLQPHPDELKLRYGI
ncbi:MAG TPA: hypothetical protein DCF45_01480 [Gammaproteobacteria bacterium]|nr:hypothetical protein [Gammaproteobacteria bacterium]